MQETYAATLKDVEQLKKRVQHLEEEIAKIKMKMAGKKWL